LKKLGGFRITPQKGKIKLLVTLRERQNLKEEWMFDVHGLHYPADEQREHRREAGVDYAAGQLFVWTAQRAQSGFVPDETDLVHIARICRLAAGMPLAIELAAS
jgi:predicted ATPase